MSINTVKNEYFGFTTACHGLWAAVGNPQSIPYNSDTSSIFRTGSIDIYYYNVTKDEHDYIFTLKKPSILDQEVLLERNDVDSNVDILHTETPGVVPETSDFDINIDLGPNSYHLSESRYGTSIDIFNNFLVVGDNKFSYDLSLYGNNSIHSGSSVDVFDLSSIRWDKFPQQGPPIWTMNKLISLSASIEGNTGSYGTSVSINSEWLAVGHPLKDNVGCVYLYRNDSTNTGSWNLHTVLTGSSLNQQFGYSLSLNKATGSFTGSLIVGTASGSTVFYYQFSASVWQMFHSFSPNSDLYNLSFYEYPPINISNVTSSFGKSVDLYESVVVIGDPTDRSIYEFSGSRIYNQGAAYIYEKCPGADNREWNLVRKFYGNSKTIKRNRMGESVGVWKDKIIIGNPRSYREFPSSCYVINSIFQQNYCNPELENVVHGQFVILQKNTSSGNWDVVNAFQKKKRFLQPFRTFGYNVDICDQFVTVGSPMLLSDYHRNWSLKETSSVVGTGFTQSLDDISGKSYFYNLNNLRKDFYVGNVFYRNGKVVLMTSGSNLHGIFFNPITPYTYEYEFQFKGKQTLYEKQIICHLEPGEFNVSTNPTSMTKEKSLFDLNNNGIFDFEDANTLLRYMRYQDTKYNDIQTTDWSSSVLKSDDEISYYNWCFERINSNDSLFSQSYYKIDSFRDLLDFNQDNKIDLNDINILWKYFSNRLDQVNYGQYITPASQFKLFSDAYDNLEKLSLRNQRPTIKSEFSDYFSMTSSDPTGSYLAPYVTTIGLYSGLDLVAVAKLATPIKIQPDYPMNFVVRIDF